MRQKRKAWFAAPAIVAQGIGVSERQPEGLVDAQLDTRTPQESGKTEASKTCFTAGLCRGCR